MNVLGLSCFYHDSAACLVIDGSVVAAAEEERFSRKKHDNSFPAEASKYCLDRAGLEPNDLDKVVFYEKPIQKFDRILETAADVFPRGFLFFSRALPEWLSTKLRVRKKLKKELEYSGKLEFIEHHRSHAASAYYPSPFDKAAILTVDGVGGWKTNQMLKAESESIEPIKHMEFPDSLGLLYSTVTAYLGFMVNNDEYKVMGLASYGEPSFEEEFNELLKVDETGSYSINQRYFSYRSRKKMWNSDLEDLLGHPRRQNEELSGRHKDIAATLQKKLEEVLLKQIDHLYSITDTRNLCMAGGVALNSVANGKIRRKSPFENIWIQPAAGDDGGAMGAALDRSNSSWDMKDVYLGPEYSEEEIQAAIKNADYARYERDDLKEIVAEKLSEGEIVSLFQGRLEWGPRALGNRSILADPRSNEMIDRVNKKVKFREEFRPFAPAVIHEKASEYFDVDGQSPYMLFVYDVREDKKDEIPAVTHVDGTSRIQTVTKDTNRFYYNIIEEFENETGVPVVLNTSFNLKGMPIVNTPGEALNCFNKSGMDSMVIGNYIVEK